MAVISHVSAVWFLHPHLSLDRLTCDDVEDLHALTTPLGGAAGPGEHTPVPRPPV
ncbi:hypothetical protein [Streptomyces sp. NBC_00859]|uniref:hypothetical protein n=1 Tax=Streptomyces sp. NBC_00859 TaxID=2903682 RepID=UPI0038652C97|nr:hypothetical protein OG584_33840 [Streptomyces sp. NBC_00859]